MRPIHEGVVLAALTLGLATFADPATAQGGCCRGQGGGGCGRRAGESVAVQSAATVAPALALSAEQLAGVHEALRDEQRGEALCGRVLQDHGDVRPFTNVVRAERRHAELLGAVLERRGVEVPPSPFSPEAASSAGSLRAACVGAAEFERAKVAVYDRLLERDWPDDARSAMEHNRFASLERHLPAFERCASRVGSGGPGPRR